MNQPGLESTVKGEQKDKERKKTERKVQEEETQNRYNTGKMAVTKPQHPVIVGASILIASDTSKK